MWKLYSPSRAEKVIRKYNGWIRKVSASYKLPAPMIKAVLYQELTQIDLGDLAADLMVLAGIFGKQDSSTGYAQIFGRVALNAANFAVDQGLADYRSLGIDSEHRLDPAVVKDVRKIWRMIHRNPRQNIELASLNLLSAAEEMTGRIDFSSYSAEELTLILTRYNADVKQATAYGREAYRHYLRYSEEQRES